MSQEEHKTTIDLYNQYVAPTYGRLIFFRKEEKEFFFGMRMEASF